MALRTLVAATAALAAATAAAEHHCVGRLAHEVLRSEVEGDWVAVRPAPNKDHECTALGFPGLDGDRRLCVGVNHDETCRTAKNPIVPLPLHARCQGCFVGASTDVFYSLNITRLHVESIGIGFRGSTILSTLQVDDDEGRAGRPRKGSKNFGETPLEFHVKLGGLDLDIKVSMPTELTYDVEARESAHGDVGARIEVDMGDNYIEYTKGQGWSHKKDKMQFKVGPIHEGDYDSMANVTLGFKSSLRAEIGPLAWFHVNVANEVPIGVNSVGTSGADLLHSCLDMGLKLDVAHEAEVDFSILEHNFTQHWGPHADRHHDGAVLHKCKDLHPPVPEEMTVVV
mmetsp:Transcript_30066/g.80082  ORF Transcript_30066/g.80082 Transcript_30066/m.80082 type:complete len:341 (-) Transcript_30066:133-1155(-)